MRQLSRYQTVRATSTPEQVLLRATAVSLVTPTGRALLHDLNVTMADEQVALVGRNGVGKTTLLKVLAGEDMPHRGEVICTSSRLLVRQALAPMVDAACVKRLFGRSVKAMLADPAVAEDFAAARLPPLERLLSGHKLSPGERRKLHLLAAFVRRPELLLLDEPSQDLDAAGVGWLLDWFERWKGGLIVVSHDRQVLRHFDQFVVVAEAGCRHVAGSFDELEQHVERWHADGQKKYARTLNVLVERERHNETVCRRRRRKKNLGRLHEERRAPARAQLMGKKSYAQASQGRAAKLREARISGVRQWARAARRALSVRLPLELPVPQLPVAVGGDVLKLDNVSVRLNGRTIFAGVSFQLGRERIALLGPNGAGKTTLLQVMTGERDVTNGAVTGQAQRLGYIAQGAENWVTDDSLVERLLLDSELSSMSQLADLLVAHQFPLALAQRSLRSLSPGERLRAALICLFQRRPAVELLVLDEPTDSLDFVGRRALMAVLSAWPGGLVVASHDRDFLDSVGIEQCFELDGCGGMVALPARPQKTDRS